MQFLEVSKQTSRPTADKAQQPGGAWRRERAAALPEAILWLALAAALLAALVPAAAARGDGGRNYALLLGAGSYEQWPDLVNPVPDVHALAAELKGRYGFLPDVVENPDREAVIAHLRRYVGMEYGPDDQLVIVFAGHGTYDEVTRIGYLAAGDSASRRHDANFVSLLSYPWLLTLIDHIPCRRILVVVDACYSGSLAASGVTSGGGGEGLSRWFVTSGGKEYVPDGDPDRHTPFVRALLAGLRGSRVGQSVNVPDLVAGFADDVEPRPQWGRFGSDEGGEPLVFTATGSAAAVVKRSPGVIAGRDGAVEVAQAAPGPQAARAVQATQAVQATDTLDRGEPDSLLRARPQRVSTGRLQLSFRSLGLRDATWNPTGDFPNQFRLQERGAWNVLSDLEAGLMWQQFGSDRRLGRDEADAYVETLNRERHAGYSDWRLPTLEELGSLIEPERHGDSHLFLYPFFNADQETCWSADHDAASGQPFYVSFNAGRTVLAYGGKTAFVRAVRSL